MEGAGILQLLAELAIGVLGFSGVVAVLGRRSSGEWLELDRVRFFFMVRATTSVLALSLIPFLFHHSGVVGRDLWGWCSSIGAIQGVVIPVAVLYLERDSRHAWRLPGGSRLALGYATVSIIGTPLLFALNALAVGFDRSFAPYLGALLLLFGTPIVLFIRLLYSALGDSRDA